MLVLRKQQFKLFRNWRKIWVIHQYTIQKIPLMLLVNINWIPMVAKVNHMKQRPRRSVFIVVTNFKQDICEIAQQKARYVLHVVSLIILPWSVVVNPRNYSDNANVQAVHCDTSSSDEDYAFGVYSSPAQSVDNINQVAHKKRGTVISAKILDVPIKLLIDSGASTNILDSKDFNKLKAKHSHINLTPSKLRLYAYMQADPLPLLGTVDTVIETKHRYVVAKFCVLAGSSGFLLGHATVTELGLLKINVNVVKSNEDTNPPAKTTDPKHSRPAPIDNPLLFGDENPDPRPSSPSPPHRPAIQHILDKYRTVFQGLGALKDYKVHLHPLPVLLLQSYKSHERFLFSCGKRQRRN